VFPTGANAGQTDKIQFQAKRFQVIPWVFSKSKYQALLRAANTKPLGAGDLRVTCTNSQYQHLEIASYDQSYLRMFMLKHPAIFEEIREQVVEKAGLLRKLIATDYTLEQLRERLGVSGSAPPAMEEVVSSTEDFDNLLEGIVE
jgi:hypothetical protein